jgi:hypothetical protein
VSATAGCAVSPATCYFDAANSGGLEYQIAVFDVANDARTSDQFIDLSQIEHFLPSRERQKIMKVAA